MNEEKTTGGVVVVGASGGIGSELCRQLSAAGESLWMIGRNSEKLQALSQELGQPCHVCDASNWDELSNSIQQADSQMQGIRGAANLAGSVVLKPAHLTSFQDLQNCLSANLLTAFGLVRAVTPVMRRGEGGTIVLLSSAATQIGLANHEAIAAAKGAVEGLMRSAAATYGPAGIRVNVVAPGLVQTGLTEKIWRNEKMAEASRHMHTLGRFGTPQEIAGAIAWLLSTQASWITGQILAIDGGLSATKVPRVAQ